MDTGQGGEAARAPVLLEIGDEVYMTIKSSGDFFF